MVKLRDVRPKGTRLVRGKGLDGDERHVGSHERHR
jgi:hypothetical protein